MTLRIMTLELPEMKKTAIGVHGIKLSKEDYVKECYLLYDGEQQSVEIGGNTVALERLKLSKRGLKGSRH